MKYRWATELQGKTVVFTHALSGRTFKVIGMTEKGMVLLEGRAGLFNASCLVEAPSEED
jgi:hypothetical protein